MHSLGYSQKSKFKYDDTPKKKFVETFKNKKGEIVQSSQYSEVLLTGGSGTR